MKNSTSFDNYNLFVSLPEKYTSFYKPYLQGFLARLLSLSILLFLVSAYTWAQNPIGKPGKAGDFEIDGDFIHQNCPTPSICTAIGLDWRSVLKPDPNHTGLVIPGISTVAGENAKWIVDGNSGVGTEVEVFRGSSNKNGDFIGTGQSPYLIETQSPSTPQKNDITNVYARAKLISGHQWVMLAAETRSVDGTSYLDFEYNQKGAHTTATNLIGDGNDGGRTARGSAKPGGGTYSSGDLLFVVDFSKGGNAPIPRIFEWKPTGRTKPTFDWFEITPLPNTGVYIVTNGADVNAAGLNTSFAGDGTASNTTLALQLVEIGVDLTALGVVVDNPCEPAATLTCKTRTSSSYTSELKDFSLFQFSLVPPATLTNLSPLTKCPDEEAVFSTTADGSGASAANIGWYKVTLNNSNQEVETPITDDNTKYDIATSGLTSTLTIHTLVAGDAGKYRAKLAGATCGAPQKDAILTMNVTAALTGLSAQNKCPAEDATFSSTASGTDASAANIGWYKVTLNNSNQEVETPIVDNNTKYDIATSGLTSTLTIHSVVTGDAGTYRAKLASAACGTPQKDGALTVKSTPDQKDGVIQPITCTDRSFQLKIAAPQTDVTYTVTQPCNSDYSSTGTAQNDGSLLFTGLKFAAGYRIVASKDNCAAEPFVCGGETCSDICSTPLRVNNVQTQEITLGAPVAKPSVVAAPNPFNDRIKFTLKSAVSGKGSLELYNTLGQKVKTVFQGYVEVGQVQNIEYAVPGAQRSNLIYIFRVGTESTSGKLIGLKQ